tara:strand:+ start:5733 stop:7286 length:1554 start_codon:yes stop_codon:yes gene_type:complete
MSLTPTSENTEIREYSVTGKVAQQGNSDALQGVDVSINTSQGNYSTKTDPSGGYTLTFKIEVVPITDIIKTDWYWDESKDYIRDNILLNKETVTTFDDEIRVGYSISYKYKGQVFNVVTDKKTTRLRSSIGLLIRERKENAIALLYDKIFDYDDGVIEEKTIIGYKANEFPNIDYNFPKYNPQSRTPYKQDNTIKRVLNVVKLETIEKAVEKDVAQTGTVDTKTAKKIQAGGTRPLPTPQKAIMKAVDTVSNRLIPYVIGILAVFGIAQVQNWLNGKKNFQNTKTTCPSRAKLLQQVRKRNKVVKQLNNLFKIIDTATKAIGIALGLLKIFQLIINIFKRLPIPSTIGTPPGPYGGVILSASYGRLLRLDDKYENIKGKLKIFAKIGGIVLTALILLRALLTQVLALLKIADEKTQQCLEELGDVEVTQLALSAELVALSNQQAEEDEAPVIKIVNGFTMDVMTDPKFKVGTLDRRRAVAKDSKGIIVLRGEPSFSATDQILIDELAFYITSNNLKA